jgi:hypothetical protein
MTLVPTDFQATIFAIFTAMNSIFDGTGDKYQAVEMAAAIKAYILTGKAATVDSGTAPAGNYAGAGTGTMTIDADSLEADLYVTFTTKNNNDELAAHMAADIDNSCKADDAVQIMSTGTVTTPSGVTSAFSGPGRGKFSGLKSIIENGLKACFSAMNDMTSGGNAYYAQQFALCLTSYLKEGSITINLQAPPFASGSGSGAIS